MNDRRRPQNPKSQVTSLCSLQPRSRHLGALRVGLFVALFLAASCGGAIRDGGVDPANLGKGDWIYYVSAATNGLGGNVAAVTNEASLMQFYKSQGLRYIIVKAGTSDQLFTGSNAVPQFTSNLVHTAHTNGLLVFGYNRSYGSNILGEVAIADYVFNQGADGFVFDAEAEWESAQPWIQTNGPAKAWELCSAVRSNWPNRFLAHSPFPIISLHTSFPYKEFGYWCDTVMPQIYPQSWSAVSGRPSGGIMWSDVNWAAFHRLMATLPPNTINGQVVYWTNAIKPLAPVNHVYGPNPPNAGVTEIPASYVAEFVDCLSMENNSPSPTGYKGASFWRSDLHGLAQWNNIKAATIGDFPGVVNNIVMDDTSAQVSGNWQQIITWFCASDLTKPLFAGAGGGYDTNSFGTTFLWGWAGTGAYARYLPQVRVPGDYELFEFHPNTGWASTGVPHVIIHGGGTNTVKVNQSLNVGRWNSLGRYYFGLGTNEIRILDSTSDSMDPVADGLKLVFLAPSSVATAPVRLKAEALGATQIAVSWTNTGTNEGASVLSRARSAAGPFLEIAAVSRTTPYYVDSGLNPNSTYYYVARATNMLGSSVNSAPASATTGTLTPVTCLGDNTFAQLQVPPPCESVIAVAAGHWHSLALLKEGNVVAWGYDSRLPAGLDDVLAIAAGGFHSLAIRRDGSVIAWGDNSAGQTNTPAKLKATAVAAGTWHSIALGPGSNGENTIVAWGDNTWGQTAVPTGLTGVVAIAAGGNHNVALKRDGTIVAWGENTDALGRYCGQSTVPWGLSNVVGVAAGKYHTVVLKADGTVRAWGDNTEGQCSVPDKLAGVIAVAAGGMHSLALRTNGVVVPWGANYSGQCSLPATATNTIAVAAGESHSLILQAGSSPYARLLSPVRYPTRFQAVVQTLCPRRYLLEYKESLSDPSWTSLPAVRGNGALQVLTDSSVAGPHRFYRMRYY